MPTLEEMLRPKPAEFKRFILRIDGQPKTSKTTLAITASMQCPPPAQWDAAKPVMLNDLLYIQFEPNALLYPYGRGIRIPNVIDWSDEGLTLADLEPAWRALPSAAEQYRAQGVTTLVVDTLTTLNRLLLRDIIETPAYTSDMERIRAYGRVDEMHTKFFNALRATKMNIIGLVHLRHFAPFGEDGGKSAIAQEMQRAAAKAVDKVEASSVGGMRAQFIPDMREKPAKLWAQLADAVLVAKPRQEVIKAGQTRMKYEFISQPEGDFVAASRWIIPAINDGYLRPIIEARYNNK